MGDTPSSLRDSRCSEHTARAVHKNYRPPDDQWPRYAITVGAEVPIAPNWSGAFSQGSFISPDDSSANNKQRCLLEADEGANRLPSYLKSRVFTLMLSMCRSGT
jgi:hypothetical protein